MSKIHGTIRDYACYLVVVLVGVLCLTILFLTGSAQRSAVRASGEVASLMDSLRHSGIIEWRSLALLGFAICIVGTAYLFLRTPARFRPRKTGAAGPVLSKEAEILAITRELDKRRRPQRQTMKAER